MTDRAWPSQVLDLRGPADLPTQEMLRQRLTDSSAGVLVTADGALLRRLRKLRRKGLSFEVFAVVPNMTLYVRQVSQLGAPRAGLNIIRYASPSVLLRTGWLVLREFRQALGNDFRAAMRILFEFELSQLRSLQPACVFLHPQITDLALAFQNPHILSDFQARVATLGGHTVAGFGTNNFGLLRSRQKEWSLADSPVLAPFNPEGFLMKPDRAQCEALAKDDSANIMADRIRVDPGAYEKATHYLRQFPGIKCSVGEA